MQVSCNSKKDARRQNPTSGRHSDSHGALTNPEEGMPAADPLDGAENVYGAVERRGHGLRRGYAHRTIGLINRRVRGLRLFSIVRTHTVRRTDRNPQSVVLGARTTLTPPILAAEKGTSQGKPEKALRLSQGPNQQHMSACLCGNTHGLLGPLLAVRTPPLARLHNGPNIRPPVPRIVASPHI